MHFRTDPNNPKDWFDSAEERVKAADLACTHLGFTPTATGLLYKSTERYLKGYLISKGWLLGHAQNLKELMSEAIRRDTSFLRFQPFSQQLTVDFVAQDYPGGDLSPLADHYPSLRQDLGATVALIKSKVPQYF